VQSRTGQCHWPNSHPLIGYRVVAILCAVDVVERSGGAPSASRRVGV